MKIKKILISILFAMILVFACGRVYANVLDFTCSKNSKGKIKINVSYSTKKDYENIFLKCSIKYNSIFFSTPKEKKIIKNNNNNNEYSCTFELDKTKLKKDKPITVKIETYNKKGLIRTAIDRVSKTFWVKDPELKIDLSNLENQIIVTSYNEGKLINVKLDNETNNIAVSKNILNNAGIIEYKVLLNLKKIKKEGTKIDITATDIYGFEKKESFNYVRPIISKPKLEGSQIKFTVSKGEGGNDFRENETVVMYRIDNGEEVKNTRKTFDADDNNDKCIECTYQESDNNNSTLKGSKFVIEAYDKYGIKQVKNFKAYNNSSSNSNAYSVIGEDTSAPICTSVEFLKNDGTIIESDFNEKEKKYYNKIINEDVTVKITFNKNVEIENNINGWAITNGKILTNTFSESMLESLSVSPTSGGDICTINLDIKVDKLAPTIKINGQEVTALNSETMIKDRDISAQLDSIKEIDYNLPIDNYTNEVTIEISDDQIDEKNIDKFVKFKKYEIINDVEEEFEKEFKNSMQLSEYGTYTILAVDEAGNLTIYKFKLTSLGKRISVDSKLLKLINDGKTIMVLEPNVTKQTFINELNINSEIKIQDKIEKDDDEQIKTGMKVKIEDEEYDIVVAGDVDGDGMIEITDIRLAKYILDINGGEEISLDESWNFNFDIDNITEDSNGNGRIDQKDIEMLKAKLDVNGDGTLSADEIVLIKYALNVKNDDNIFNKEDIELMEENATGELEFDD